MIQGFSKSKKLLVIRVWTERVAVAVFVVFVVAEINKEKWLFWDVRREGRTSINRWPKTLEIYSGAFLIRLSKC